MKKILFVWQNLDIGGGETALINLLERLNNIYEIELLCYENINRYILPENIKVNYSAYPSKNWFKKTYNKLKFFILWFDLSRKHEIQIINENPFMCIVGLVVSLITRKKYLLWEHSCRSEMGSGFSKLITMVYRFSLKKSSLIICVSNYAANSMKKYLNSDAIKIEVIPNILKFKPINKMQRSNEVINLCAVGRLAPEKNFSLLINAMAQIVFKVDKKVHLNICGDGEEYDLLNNLIEKLHLRNFVTLVGHTDNVIDYVNNCDIFISNSNSESLSTVVCEALYCSKCVVSTNTGAGELLENGKYGVIIEKGNLNQLVDTLVNLILDREKRNFFENKSSLALNKFEPGKIVEHWENIIERYFK